MSDNEKILLLLEALAIERSDKRILSYLKDMALNEDGEQAKASLGLL